MESRLPPDRQAEPRFRVLVGDGDTQIAGVVQKALTDMGLFEARLVSSAEEAACALQSSRHDLLIMDWTLRGDPGDALIRRIRRDVRTARPVLPILFLSGRAEEADIVRARDAGANEYIRKPFTAHSLFDRLGYLIEEVPPFVVSHGYVGPCRRRQVIPPLVERRRVQPPQRKGPAPMTRVLKASDPAVLLAPDLSLKKRLAPFSTLSAVLPEGALDAAQAGIDSAADTAVRWMRDDLRHLNIYYQAMQAEEYSPVTSGAFAARALSLHTRAGTFGFEAASMVAALLHRFAQHQLIPSQEEHRRVVRKHLDILQLAAAPGGRALSAAESAAMAARLREMTERLEPPPGGMRLPRDLPRGFPGSPPRPVMTRRKW